MNKDQFEQILTELGMVIAILEKVYVLLEERVYDLDEE